MVTTFGLGLKFYMANKFFLWLRAVRPFAYPASVIPALLGITLAWHNGAAIRIDLAIITVLGAIAIHTATNLLQDYFDYKNGLDRPGTLGGSGVLVEGLLSPRAIFVAALLFFLFSAILAIPLIVHAGPPLIIIIGLGLIAGAGYAVPRMGFKYLALGDVAVFFAFGIGITLGSYVVQAREISWQAILCAVPFGLLVVGILHANNMRDMKDDDVAGVRTLAVILGMRGSRIYYTSLIFGAYAVVVIGALLNMLPFGVLFSILTLPLALKLVKNVWRADLNDTMAHADARTAKLSLMFGLAMIAGTVIMFL